MSNLFVGIDVSLKDFKVRVMDDQGAEPAKRQRYLYNQLGLDDFIDFIFQKGGSRLAPPHSAFQLQPQS